jgi:hypothetical protein
LSRKFVDHRQSSKLASQGVKLLADKIRRDSHKFAMHAKGHDSAVYSFLQHAPDPMLGHLNRASIDQQNLIGLGDFIGVYLFDLGGYRWTQLF